MAIDLKGLSPNQLNELISRAQVRQSELRREKISVLREKIVELIKSEGYSFDEVFGAARSKSSRGTGSVPPKFRNPANPEQTWTGRGKRPHWFSDALKAGKQPQDLAI
ncbi:H-NS histone family protein [Frateuria aurantia]